MGWADFRNHFLGATDPAAAPADSLRGALFTDWERLGLSARPWIGENGIHASASPFEALSERRNWLGQSLHEDPFGRQLLSAGLARDMLEAWMRDPQVMIGEDRQGGVFDQLEDLDTEARISKCIALSGLQN